MKMIKKLIIKYKEIIIYVLFGGCTTVVNLTVFHLSNLVLGEERYLISNAIAWVAAIIFAFITNKLWVFKSKSWSTKVLAKEIPSFFSARVFSFFIEESGLYLLVDPLGFSEYEIVLFGFEIGGELIAKGIVAVVVVIVNYIFTKFLVFRKKK